MEKRRKKSCVRARREIFFVEPTVENEITQHQQTHKEIIIIGMAVLFNSKLENFLVIFGEPPESDSLLLT
jgi:hypothetical protein